MLRQLCTLIVVAGIALASSVAFGAANAECIMCHSASGLTKQGKDGRPVSLQVSESSFNASVHGGMLCVDCHKDMAGQPFPHKTQADAVKCRTCHEDGRGPDGQGVHVAEEYSDSVHGKAAANDDPDAPRCKDCHGYHDVRGVEDPISSVYRTNIPKTCGRCHSDSRIVRDHNIPAKGTPKLYENSVHGRAVEKQGLISAAVCTDCHGSHGVKSASDPDSTVNHPNIPETCGRCHSKVYEEYQSSIHGAARRKGIEDAPVCTDCHGEHTIQRISSPGSSVYPTHVVATCSKCHENARIQKAYGLPADRLATYIGSYHGIANKYGETTVANCATCHGAHNILPSSDRRSLVNARNLPHTCGKCHPGAGTNFAKGNIHIAPSPTQDKKIFLVQSVYRMFVFGMIASFAGYIGLDLISRWRRRGRHSEEDR